MKKSHFHTPSQNKQSAGTGQLTALKDLERFTPDNTAQDSQPPEALKTTTNSGLFCHFIIDRFLSSIKAIPEKPGEGFAPQSKVKNLSSPSTGATVGRRHTLQSPSKGVLSLPKRLRWALIAPCLFTAIRHLEVDGRSAEARRPGKAENAAPQSTAPARPRAHQLAEFSPMAKPRERGRGPGKAWVQTPEDDAQRGRDNGRRGPARGASREAGPPRCSRELGRRPELGARPRRGAALVPGPQRTRRGAGGRPGRSAGPRGAASPSRPGATTPTLGPRPARSRPARRGSLTCPRSGWPAASCG
ncbi:translation initiation factor IF-2-like [Felis catus]|uniref:translation initiation factor IF-2-like n=1 Tax=Felis catus TaxID=9685 RepID=UPI001D199523|nr:translation initiation factor IF-2-like [Felis catus]